MKRRKAPCEVCGSVGIADSIMICFACRDTREHTYCARVLLPSVPPFWICEACRFSSPVLLVPHVAHDLVDSVTNVDDCSSDHKNSNNSRQEDQETEKLRTKDIEQVVDTVQASTSDSTCEISANINSVIHPHTNPLAKETPSVSNETSQDKEQHQQSQDFPRKHKKLRLMDKHIPQPQQTLVSPHDQSITDMPQQSVKNLNDLQ